MEKQDIEFFKKEFNRIHVKLNKLMQEQITTQNKETWVKVGLIKKLTGWNRRDLEYARMNSLVKAFKRKGQMNYLLESLNPMFIKVEYRTDNTGKQAKEHSNAEH